MKLRLIVTGVLTGILSVLRAQDPHNIEKLLESHEVLRSDDQYEDMTAVLEKWQNAPLNLNTATFDSLKMLFFLSDSQIDNLLVFRRKHGVFLHVNELLLVPGIGRRDVENIRSFVTVKGGTVAARLKGLKAGTVQELLVRGKTSLPRQEGYKLYSPREFKTREQYLKKERSRFKGIPLGTLVKYKAQVYSRLQLGITLENDPGKAYFTRYQKTGFDFLSAYVTVTTDSPLKRVIAGDYRLQWGQGLVAWSGFASGKSAETLGNEKAARGFSPYSSTDENSYLRGIALSLQPCPALTADFFFSRKKTDGNLGVADSLAEEDMLTATLYESGYHRNQNECEKKHTLKELTTGAELKWNTTYFKVGLHGLYYHFTPRIEPGGEIYQRYKEDGHHRFLTGIDYKTGFRNVYFFGETAFSEKGGVATLNGLRFSGSSRVSACVIYRRYDRHYVSHYSGGFGEYSNTSNEEGVYVGMDLNVVKGLKINAYYDYFRFFSPRYNAFIPASGHEMLLNMTYDHSRFSHILRIKQEEKPEDRKIVALTSVLRKRTDLRYQFGFRRNRQLEWHTRFDWAHYAKAGVSENGYMISQDFVYTSRRGKMKMQLRWAYFDTDSYNSRIYSYEHNVLYGYSFPAYYDRGIRTYINLNWKAASRLTLYFKSGFTCYPDRENIGSSVTKVEGHNLWDLVVQLRMKF